MQLDKISYSGEEAVIQLKGECSILNIYITTWQADAIQEGMQGAGYRPGTHDIITQIMEEYNIRSVMVKITHFQDNTYFAQLYLQNWNHLSILDIRPSDAVAIAVRTNTPIYVNESLIEKTC
jgi:bifunctional DNase/RNase